MAALTTPNLLKKTKQILQQYHITLAERHSQHFLIDHHIITQLINSAHIQPEDKVLEIGPGTGNITITLAKKSHTLITVEIDKQFQPILEKISQNTQLIIDDIQHAIITLPIANCNKIIANIPYHLSEPILRRMITLPQFTLALFIFPKTLATKLQKHPVFSAFFTLTHVQDIPKTAFYPIPNTVSTLIKITRRPDYSHDHDTSAYIRRKLYLQRNKKLKNALRDTLIDFYEAKYHTALTKKEANNLVSQINISARMLAKSINHAPLSTYTLIADFFGAHYKAQYNKH